MSEDLAPLVAPVGAHPTSATTTSWRRRVGALLAMITLLSVTAALATSSPAAANCDPNICNGNPYDDPGSPNPPECPNDQLTLADPNCPSA